MGEIDGPNCSFLGFGPSRTKFSVAYEAKPTDQIAVFSVLVRRKRSSGLHMKQCSVLQRTLQIEIYIAVLDPVFLGCQAAVFFQHIRKITLAGKRQ